MRVEKRGLRSHASMPTVSIILPTFNRTRLLRLAVDSVLAQTFTDWELIVADDGSGEETKAYLRGLEAENVKVLCLAHSGNPSRARNAALTIATGRYVAFLDSDDVWASAKLAAQLAALGARRECRWSYTACDRIGADGCRLPAALQPATAPLGGWIFEPLLALEVSVAMPTLVAERSLIDEIGGFDEEQLYGEFHDLCLRLSLHSEAVALAEALCSVRAHDQHYSADRVAAHRSWMRLYEKHCRLAPTAAARACSERMLARAALNLAALQGANRDVRGVWRTLRAGKVLSWRRRRLWGRSALALLRPFVPSSWKTGRFRLLRRRGATV
jgi:glycosyltransferase involved in cell wall biosynthesis